MILFRPTGPQELKLVAQFGWRAWPPRLPEQPIFYPVLNFDYAEQIARDWNSTTAQTNFWGYVTQFEINDEAAAKYPAQNAGAAGRHAELWVPSEELNAFNASIIGKIAVVAAYRHGKKLNELPNEMFDE